MQSAFTRLVREEKVFCKECSAVTPHRLLTQEPLVSYEAVDPDLRIMTHCKNCNAHKVLFAGDFRTFVPDRGDNRGCKIPGRSRIQLDDLIYVEERTQPARVLRRWRVQEKINVEVEFPDGEREVIRFTQREPVREESARTYQLLPAQANDARIGDWVFHVERKMVGQVVGVTHAGRSQLVIRMEGGIFILFRRSDGGRMIPDNRILLKGAEDALQRLEELDSRYLRIAVTNGVIYLSGTVNSLPEREMAVDALQSLDGVLAVLPQVTVVPSVFLSDDELKDALAGALQRFFQSGLRGLRIAVSRGSAEVSGEIEGDLSAETVRNRLIAVEGLCNLTLRLRKRTPSRRGNLFSGFFPFPP